MPPRKGGSGPAYNEAAPCVLLPSENIGTCISTLPETQPEPKLNRRDRRAAQALKGQRRQPRGTLARMIYKRRKFGRVHVSVEPTSRIEGLNRVFDTDAEADTHVIWLRSEYGWPYCDEGAAEPLREDGRHLATPKVHIVLRLDDSFLVGVFPRPRRAKPPLTFFSEHAAAIYAERLAHKYGSPSTGALQIFTQIEGVGDGR